MPLQRCDENVIEAQIVPALKRLAQGQHLAFYRMRDAEFLIRDSACGCRA